VLLIDDRTPPPQPQRPERPTLEPDWPLCASVLGAVTAFAATFVVASTVATYVLTCVAMLCAGYAFVRALPAGHADGLSEHRQ
jgi:hypothetical protein